MRVLIAAALLAVAGALPLWAQTSPGDAAMLLADRVEIGAGDQLVATGNVEVLQGDVRLRARRILYDPQSDSLTVDGPITLTQGAETVILADSAALSTDLQNGILRSARMVLNQQMQLAAAELARVNGRYTQLYKTVASSCHVCAAHPVPLWQIRAKRVIHDQQERQLYFDNARFEVAGLPVMWLPRLRLPDPTLKRATGFLTPEFRSTDELGFGVKIPYFIRIGDHKDLTLTPYLSSARTTTLEFRYRQAFRRGDLMIEGAISDDDIRPGETRGYIFAEGGFDLGRDFRLSFDIEASSDDSYLLDYDYSSKDRLDSAIALTRTRRDEYIGAELVNLWSLRAGDDNETQPFLVGDAVWERRFEPGALGGIASWSIEAHTHLRRSTTDGVAGRDVTRLSGALEWQRSWVAPAGVLISAETRLQFDHSTISDDSAFPDPVTELTPIAAIEARWPLMRAGTGGVTHVIEPVAQLVWSPDGRQALPNDESTQIEFDEGNLFSLSRFPGGDQIESGLRLNLGLSWTRHDPMGWSMGVTVGRILRRDDLGQFTGYSELDGDYSDWLVALRLDLPQSGLSLSNRALFDDSFSFARNELRLDWVTKELSMSSSYIWMEANPTAGRIDSTNELKLSGAMEFNDRWSASLDWRYDLSTDRSASAELGVKYRTDCVSVALEVGRRFTSSTQLNPTTSYGLQIGLEGIGGNGRRVTRHRCSF